MLKKIQYGLFCASILLGSNAFAMQEHLLQYGSPPIEIILNSNEPQVFPNPFMWAIKGHCTIISNEADNFISIKALRKSGSVNGVKLTEGHSVELTVHPDEMIFVMADPGAKVEISNTGLISFKAMCAAD